MTEINFDKWSKDKLLQLDRIDKRIDANIDKYRLRRSRPDSIE